MNSVPLWLQLLRSYCLHFPLMRGKWRLVTWAYQNMKIPEANIQSNLDGSLGIALQLDIWIDFNIYCLGIYEYYLANFFKRNIKADTIFIDVGSYIGQYALLAAREAPQGRVFGFEPNRQSAQRFKENVNLNYFSNIEVIRKAVGDYEGHTSFYISQQPYNSSILAEHTISNKEERVPITRLDHFCEEQELPRVDIIKIDVEGAEDRVIRGALGLVDRNKPLIILEIGRKSTAESHSEALSLLESLGYQFYTFQRARLSSFNGTFHSSMEIIATTE